MILKSQLPLILFLGIILTAGACRGDQALIDTILEQHAEAMGGKARWAALQSYSQTFIRPNGPRMVMTCLMPDRITLHFYRDSSELIKGYDSEYGYLVRNGVYEPMRPGEAIEMAEEMHYYSELIFARDEGYQVHLLADEAVDGIPCYKLQVIKSAKDEQIYWINKETFFIEQTGEFSEDSAHAGIYYKTRLQDYRQVKGCYFPFRQALIPSDRAPIYSEITTTVVDDPTITADQFEYRPNTTGNLIRYWQDRYREDQLQSLTFVQQTIRYETREPDTSVWYEAIHYPDRFRIDFGDSSALNRNLYRNDSVYVLRKGQEVHRGREIQEFTIMEGSLYAHPPDTTLSKLQQTGVDTNLFHLATYLDRPTYIIGASAGDLSRPQIWLDAERRYTVRRFSRTDAGQLLEVQYDDFQLIDNHYIETELRFLLNGKLIQTEHYDQIAVNPQLDAAIFDPGRYRRIYWY